jgi:hypothetical protein
VYIVLSKPLNTVLNHMLFTTMNGVIIWEAKHKLLEKDNIVIPGVAAVDMFKSG